MAKKTTKKTAKRPENQLWNNICGEMRVWGKEFSKGKGKKKEAFICYSTSIGKKNDDDEYDNLYFNVFFKRDEAPDREDAFVINVKSGFLTLTVGKDDVVRPAVMVMDYDIKSEAEDEDEDEDGLPF